MAEEFVVTGQLKNLSDNNQTLILHRSFITSCKEQAIKDFHSHFEPELKVMKIFSVIDENGDML
jgi:hypothetical protein